MARLKVSESPQQGSSTGATKHAEHLTPEKPAALGADRARRSRKEAGVTVGSYKKRTTLSKDHQALMLVQYGQLPKGKAAFAAGLAELVARFNVNRDLPAALTK
jgi:hypothetical protein